MAGGKGTASHISIIKKGISINNQAKLENLPSLCAKGIFILDNFILLRFFGHDGFVTLSCQEGAIKNSFEFVEIQTPDCLNIDSPLEDVILVKKCCKG